MFKNKPTQPIPAVAYVRKSTRGTRSDGKERQEKSLQQQRREVIELAKARNYQIIRWYEDEGISGWKREAARPGFARMLADAKERRDFRVIICDDADRFSRASYRKALRDVDELAEAGVQIISCVSQGDFRIDDENDAGEAHRFIAVAMANHEYSRKLSRRVTLARRNAAEQGKRTGGPAPYGLANDGRGGLKPGEPKKAQIVTWLFDQFGNHLLSLHGLASDLNAREVPGPTGGKWHVKTIAGILRNRCYRGDFSFNRNPEGQFYGMDAEGDVVEKGKLDGAGKVFLHEGVYEPLVETALFDRVQDRLETVKSRSRRKRMGYALSGILKCDHCGLPMYGVKPQGHLPTIYRCTADGSHGGGSCGYRQVREDRILPFVLRMLGKEIAHLKEVVSSPPEHLCSPANERAGRRKLLEQERRDLVARIARAEENLLEVEDARTRKSLEARVTAWRDELERLDAEMALESDGERHTREQLDALMAWWDEFDATALSMPVPTDANLALAGGLHQDPFSEESAILVHPRKVNEALHQLGCEIRLRWETREHISRAGNSLRRHVLVRGRFRLGQREGSVPVYVLEPAAGRLPFLVPALLHQGDAEVVVRLRVVGPEAEGRTQGCFRLLETALLTEGDAEVGVRLGEVGLEPERLAQGRLRLLVPALAVQGIAVLGAQPGVVRLLGD
jgi:site-specific DNA recombinase